MVGESVFVPIRDAERSADCARRPRCMIPPVTGTAASTGPSASRTRISTSSPPGDTLTATYDVTVTDGITSSTQSVTVTATGAADPLVGESGERRRSPTPPIPTPAMSSRSAMPITRRGRQRRRCQLPRSASRPSTAKPPMSIPFIAGTYGKLFVDSERLLRVRGERRASMRCRSATIRPSNSTSPSATASARATTTTLTFNIHRRRRRADHHRRPTSSASVTEDAGPTTARPMAASRPAISPAGPSAGATIQARVSGIRRPVRQLCSAMLGPPGGSDRDALAGRRHDAGPALHRELLRCSAIPKFGNNELVRELGRRQSCSTQQRQFGGRSPTIRSTSSAIRRPARRRWHSPIPTTATACSSTTSRSVPRRRPATETDGRQHFLHRRRDRRYPYRAASRR